MLRNKNDGLNHRQHHHHLQRPSLLKIQATQVRDAGRLPLHHQLEEERDDPIASGLPHLIRLQTTNRHQRVVPNLGFGRLLRSSMLANSHQQIAQHHHHRVEQL